ncbi:myb/sant-like dna-binding domain [Holotrichia oblita]|uniref:Myb/sant-like dna-binding domain n=1 Tax=Holotrichia oblita TaxID=644536 RepID=A0ACB9SNX7_HOLOL|nr:myb/sant-like dna-binding domain [Holotrichia oblita]
MEAKRQRASNFTADERVALLNIVKNYKHILENKKTDAITWREKEGTAAIRLIVPQGIWLRIEKEFNATSPACINRSQEQLRKCYENQKKIVRKIAANNRLNLCKTGGGPSSCNDSNNPTYDLTMSILSQKMGKPAAVSNKAEASTADNAWSSRRRPATSANIMLARKFEDLVDTKQEIANIQLEVLKKERDDIIERGFREKEEFLIKKNQMLEIHEIQKQLLLLDVEVKKAQLDKLQTM